MIAARLLGLSEKTVRAWTAAGVLAVARHSPRLLLDIRSVHARIRLRDSDPLAPLARDITRSLNRGGFHRAAPTRRDSLPLNFMALGFSVIRFEQPDVAPR